MTEGFAEYETQQRELRLREKQAETERLRLTGDYVPGRTAEEWTKLRAPFEGDDVGKLPKGKEDRNAQKTRCGECGGYHVPGLFHVDYVGHAVVTMRLNEVDPAWVLKPGEISFDDELAYMVGALTVLGVTKYDVGCADMRKDEWPKLLFSDTLTRCAMRFGVATNLWKKSGPGGEATYDRGARSSRAGSSGPRSGSQGSGAQTGRRESVGVLFEALKLAVSTIESDGGRAEWEDFKGEKGWDRIWAESPEIRESKRPLIEAALECVRSIRLGEKARSAEPGWDPLADPVVPEGELDSPDPGEVDAAEAAADDAREEAERLDEVEGYGDYG